MFPWFTKAYPVPLDDKLWIERRMTELTDKFGWDALLARPVIQPVPEFFPDVYHGRPDDAQQMLARMAHHMQADGRRISLELFEPNYLPVPHAGFFDSQRGNTSLWISRWSLAEPPRLAAALAHGVVHALLDDAGLLSSAESEAMNDLASVFLGAGILTGNAMLRHATPQGPAEGKPQDKYLRSPLFGYALALFARARGSGVPHWSGHLRLDLRVPFRRGLRYLASIDTPRFTA